MAVVGAGVAGAMAARLMAERGLAVVLVERCAFPRHKVCGGCLNRRSLAILKAAGLDIELKERGAVPLDTAMMAAGGRAARVPLPGGLAVSRALLDSILVKAARDRGVLFLDQTTAKLGTPGGAYRPVHLSGNGHKHTLSARLILAADGLQGNLLGRAGEGWSRVASRSRVGVGAVLPNAPANYEPGTVYMACAPRGYVGLVRAEEGQLVVAGAFDPDFLRACGGPSAATEAVLACAPFTPPELDGGFWSGTPPLTRRREHFTAERVWAIGDAAGYVEPFTGEGMAWALSAARDAANLAGAMPDGDWAPLAAAWERSRRRAMRRQRLLCHVTARVLRSPRITRGLAVLLSRNPALLRPLVQFVNAEHRS